MRDHVIDASEAFTEGAQLWIAPTLARSAWTRKLDWYLNLQLLRAEHHTVPGLAPALRTLLQQEELADQGPDICDTDPLMIAARSMIPTEQVVVVFETETQKWIESAQRVWQSLGRPTVRLFLPTDVTPQQVGTRWDKNASISLVLASA